MHSLSHHVSSHGQEKIGEYLENEPCSLLSYSAFSGHGYVQHATAEYRGSHHGCDIVTCGIIFTCFYTIWRCRMALCTCKSGTKISQMIGIKIVLWSMKIWTPLYLSMWMKILSQSTTQVYKMAIKSNAESSIFYCHSNLDMYKVPLCAWKLLMCYSYYRELP